MNSAIRWSPPTRLCLANTRTPWILTPGGVGLDEMPLLMENVMDAKQQQQQLACVGRKSSSTPMLKCTL